VLDRVSITVDHLDAAVTFYGAALGRELPGQCRRVCGGTNVNAHQTPQASSLVRG